MLNRIKHWFIIRWLERERSNLTYYSQKALKGFDGLIADGMFCTLSYQLRQFAAVSELCTDRLESIKLHAVIDELLANVPYRIHDIVVSTHFPDSIEAQTLRKYLLRKCDLMKSAINDYYKIITIVEAHCETNDHYYPLNRVMEDYRSAIYNLDGFLKHIQSSCVTPKGTANNESVCTES